MLRWGKIEVSGGFFLTAAALFYVDTSNVLLWAGLACALHEAGHWVAVRLFGGRILALRLTAVGGELVLDRRAPLTMGGELLSILAGPGANLTAALLAARLGREELAFLFAGLNLALGFFNLLPIWPLDGGRILELALSGTRWEPLAKVCSALGAALLLLAGGAALFQSGRQFTLLLLAVWLTAGTVREQTKKTKNCLQ